VSGDRFTGFNELESYLDATSGELIRIAIRVLGGGERFALTAANAGVAFGLVGLARSLVFHAQRGKLFLPVRALEAHGIEPANLLAISNRSALQLVLNEVAARAIGHYQGLRMHRARDVPLAAFLPAALVPLYARQFRRRNFDLGNPEVPLYARLAVLLRAAITGRI